ncbi:MAG: class I SAM-dependent methyltransferase [Clostridia bacterium]
MVKVARDWKDYEVIATGDGEKLERWGALTLLRPDPQVIWHAKYPLKNNKQINAVYERSSAGGGEWVFKTQVPATFNIERKGLVFSCKLMGFKHTGLFPEQAVNWDIMTNIIANGKGEIKVLNLFAYTGGATVACAKAGAKVTHVDSAKAMVDRAKLNCTLSNVKTENVRFIVDDCIKFVKREIKRGNTYDAVIMDPPSYGRGANGEMWKIEDNLCELVELCCQVLTQKPLFFLVNSYTTGLQPTVINNILKIYLGKYKGDVESYEVALPTNEDILLPCGCSGIFIGK